MRYGTWKLQDLVDPDEVAWASMVGRWAAAYQLRSSPSVIRLAAFDRTGTEEVASWDNDALSGTLSLGHYLTPRHVRALGRFLSLQQVNWGAETGSSVEYVRGGALFCSEKNDWSYHVKTGVPRALYQGGVSLAPEESTYDAERRIRALLRKGTWDVASALQYLVIPECVHCARGLSHCVAGHVLYWDRVPQDLVVTATRTLHNSKVSLTDRHVKQYVRDWLRRGALLAWRGTS